MLAMDIDRAACETFDWNHPRVRNPEEGLVAGGQRLRGRAAVGTSLCCPPHRCHRRTALPAFSLSNVHKRSDDPRLKLPGNYAHILSELNKHYGLDFFVFENVLGLRNKAHAELFGYFKKLFASAGFTIFEGELDAQDFGVAQVRKRVFVVGFNREEIWRGEIRVPEGKPKPEKYSEGNDLVAATSDNLRTWDAQRRRAAPPEPLVPETEVKEVFQWVSERRGRKR